MASVLVIQGAEKGRTFELPDRECVIGRDSDAVRLTDRTVSRRHARLLPKNGTWMLEDFGSANGTYLNGVRIKGATRVHGGDQVRCGSTLLVFASGLSEAVVNLEADGDLVDAAIVATIPSNEDSVIIPTPEAGAQAIGNLRILYNLIGEISSIFNIDLLLQQTLNKIFEVVKADRGHVLLIDQAGRLTLKASRVAEGIRAGKPPISRTIIKEVVSKQVGVLSSNAMSDKRFAAGKSVHDFGIRSALCVPIRGRDRILGVIHVDCSVSEHTYTTEQLRLLTAIGYQAGLAVENVLLYEAAVQSERLAAIGETAAFLSHHIKNILQALSAGADVVGMGLRHSDLPKARKGWPIVQRSLQRINELILNMLAFSKDRQPLCENVSVNHVLGECLELIRARADERGVVVLSDLEEMPAIPADAAGLHQAFMNLLTNALEAVEDSRGVITISSEFDTMNRQALVRIMDNGLGIEESRLGEVFQPFYSSKGQKGTGLGLAVTHKIVQEHHGRIDVESKTGEGTTFTITLPAVEVDTPDASDTHSASKTSIHKSLA